VCNVIFRLEVGAISVVRGLRFCVPGFSAEWIA
jgi:hypothetical protein